jgi:hypothetical protein
MEHAFWPLLNLCTYGRDDVDGISESLGAPVRGWIPDEAEEAREALDAGTPLYVADAESSFSKAVRKTAARVHEELQT